MAEQLSACARQLFEGAPGSAEQRAANAWLMQFQARDEAWQAALELLQSPPREAVTGQPLAAPELAAMQILRLKTQQEWVRISPSQRQIVRQTLLELLEAACVPHSGATRLTPVSFRLACITVADLVVKSGSEWVTWKADLQRLVDAAVAVQSSRGALMLAEVLGAIPVQILLSARQRTDEEMLEVLTVFQPEGDEVMAAVRMLLCNIPEAKSSALRCLENWVVGCIPAHESFGLSAAHLFASRLTDLLFDIVTSDNEEQSQLAAGILADSFACTPPSPASESLLQAVLYAGSRLVGAIGIFQSQVHTASGAAMDKEQHTIVCRGLSRVVCSLAMNHAPALFSGQTVSTIALAKTMDVEQQQQFAVQFLELLLACSAHSDFDVVQPTLEIWFFFLEDQPSQNEVSLRLLEAPGREYAVDVLSRLVNALIERCKYPQWFIERQQISSDDHEIEAISSLRREIADTLLSLFAKWPADPGKPRGDYVSCVKGLAQMLLEFSDVALVDALLYLLSYMVELFDVVSSDSETDDEQPPLQAPSTGVGILLGVLNCSAQLPMHPLVINGIARYLQALSAALVLPAKTYLRTALMLCQGLGFRASFPVAVQSLLQNSAPIIKYTEPEERAPLLEALLSFCNSTPGDMNQETKGDLLEATFRVASGIPAPDFETLCSSALSSQTTLVQSTNAAKVCDGVYMLSRAVSGAQDTDHGQALVDQLWSLVSAALIRHKEDEHCRRAGVHFFLSVMTILPRGGVHPIETQILDVCLWWYGEGVAPDILTCCSRIVARQCGNAGFETSAGQAIERLLGAFRHKLRDDPATPPEVWKQSMEELFTHHHQSEMMAAEITQFMRLAREVLSSFPQVMVQERPDGQPTLYWTCLELALRLLAVDHQEQGVSDALCDFILDAMRCQPAPIAQRLDLFARETVRVVLSFLGPKRVHYRLRNLWDFLFQCLHAPQIPIQLRDGFRAAVTTVVLEEGVLNVLLPVETWRQVPGELAVRRQRHRFRQYFAQLVRLVEAERPGAVG